MSLFPKGHKDPLFRSRMIRPVLGGRGLYLSETNLGSGDGKPVQQIERKGVGEELTTCGVIHKGHDLTSYNSRRLVSASSMKRLIYIDGQDKQDYLARGFSGLSSTIAFSSTRISKTRSQAHGSLHTHTRSSSESASCAAASRPVYPVYRCSLMQQTGLTEHVPIPERP